MKEFAASTSRRLPLPEPDTWSAETREAIRHVVDGPRGALLGPFVPLARSAGLLDSVQSVGEFLRFHSAVRGKVLETVILTVAARWGAAYEWEHHAPIALQQGVSQECLEAIRSGTRPTAEAEVAAAWTVVDELLREGDLTDATYLLATERWGEARTVELVAAAGYYTLLAWVLNTAQVVPDPPEASS